MSRGSAGSFVIGQAVAVQAGAPSSGSPAHFVASKISFVAHQDLPGGGVGVIKSGGQKCFSGTTKY